MIIIVHRNRWWWGEDFTLIEASGMAMVELCLQDEYPSHGYICSLKVFEDARREGYATTLLKAAEDIARKAGLKYLYLGVDKQKPEWLKKWYQKMGFRDAGDEELSEGHCHQYIKDLTKSAGDEYGVKSQRYELIG